MSEERWDEFDMPELPPNAGFYIEFDITLPPETFFEKLARAKHWLTHRTICAVRGHVRMANCFTVYCGRCRNRLEPLPDELWSAFLVVDGEEITIPMKYDPAPL